MSFDALREMALGVAFDILSVPATVTLPDAAPVMTSVIWHSAAVEDTPSAGDLQRRSVKRLLSVPRTDVQTLPRGTAITAAEFDGAAIKNWEVDEIALVEVDHIRAFVIEV